MKGYFMTKTSFVAEVTFKKFVFRSSVWDFAPKRTFAVQESLIWGGIYFLRSGVFKKLLKIYDEPFLRK